VKPYLTRLTVIGVLVIAGGWLWSNRDRIGVLSNINVRIQGDWHIVEMNFANSDVYTFTESLVSLNGEEWATYKLLSGSRIEITTRGEITVYELGFPDDENMIWSIHKGEKVVPAVHWRR
jgi:hypothetical protein